MNRMDQQTANENAVLVLQEGQPLPIQSTQEKEQESMSNLGNTLPDLLYGSLERYKIPRMFSRREAGEWTSVSLEHFKDRVEQLALGLEDLGLQQGDRVALYMESDTLFAMADMGCLLAGLIDVPIYLNQSTANNEYILQHSGARAIFVSNMESLHAIGDVLTRTPDIKTVIVGDLEGGGQSMPLPEGMQWLSMETLYERGAARMQEAPERVLELRDRIDPADIATIVYTSGTTGEPKGAMLTHENLSHNALTALGELGGTRGGPHGDTTISFLPMSHIFARTMYYAAVAYGVRTHFTTPDRLGEDLREIRPTILVSVPRVLEKVYSRILEKITVMKGFKKKLANWSLDVAAAHKVDQRASLALATQLVFANALVFKKWRAALGGRMKYIIVGGAAMNPDLVNLFGAAGVPILQGYGLTETSPVIAFNRPSNNRPGTVGELLPGIEVKIAEDGEIVTRGPHVMKGYFNNPEKTSEVLTDDGWFHTGDIGELDEEGLLRITDRKKSLFKLSTGKYVMPQPLENRLNAHPLIEQAVVLGSGRKFCSALIFIDQGTLNVFAEAHGLTNVPLERLIEHPKVQQRYSELVDLANNGMDHWSTIKHFKLMIDALSIDNGMLTPTLKIKRRNVSKHFSSVIEALYAEAESAVHLE